MPNGLATDTRRRRPTLNWEEPYNSVMARNPLSGPRSLRLRPAPITTVVKLEKRADRPHWLTAILALTTVAGTLAGAAYGSYQGSNATLQSALTQVKAANERSFTDFQRNQRQVAYGQFITDVNASVDAGYHLHNAARGAKAKSAKLDAMVSDSSAVGAKVLNDLATIQIIGSNTAYASAQKLFTIADDLVILCLVAYDNSGQWTVECKNYRRRGFSRDQHVSSGIQCARGIHSRCQG